MTALLHSRYLEHAFTLIEMVVAMVLTTIAAGIVASVIVQGIAGSSGARAGSVSDAAIRRSVDAMSDDIARAATTDRRDGAVRDPIAFAQAVRAGSAAWKPARRSNGAVDMNAAMVRADIDDVRAASGSRFSVAVGSQCITWAVVQSTLIRSVAPVTNCAATTSRRVYIRSESARGGLNRAPFTYQVVCNPAVCAGARPVRGTPPCRPHEVTSVATNQLRWVVGIDATLATITIDSKGTSESSGSISQSMRSRETASYRQALGC